MPAVRHCSRIDTFELKAQMEKRLGTHKAEKYFNLLTRYLSLKVGKSEFDKLCVRLIGRENVRLHNELIKAIVKNAVFSKTPPQKQVTCDGPLMFKDSNGGVDSRNGLQSLCRDVFPQSPKKGRTPNLRERKFKDRPSPLGVNGKSHMVEDLATRSQEQTVSSSSKQPIEVNNVEKRVDMLDNGAGSLSPVSYKKVPITTPFGVSIHSHKKRKVLNNGPPDTCHYNGQFLPTNALENRVKQKLKTEGLDISADCVSLLNNGVLCYLERVIKPSLELAGVRTLHKPEKRFTTSLLDFRLTTETNPKILGEDWPGQLEKISLFSSEQSAAFDNSHVLTSE